MASPQSKRSHKPFWITIGIAALLGVTQGIGGALVLGGTTALVWVIVQTARRRRALALPATPNALVAAAAVVVIAFGSTMVDTSGIDQDPATQSPTAHSSSEQGSPTPGQSGDNDATSSPSQSPDAAPDEAADDSTDADPAPGGADQPDQAEPPATTDSPDPAPGSGDAAAALAALATKGRAPKTGYDRDSFAYRSFDLDGNGCDVRNDVLRRDLTRVVLQTGTNGCVVLSGVLNDPYSGTDIAFTRGQATSADVQIDHVVALSDAWQKGAGSWDADKKKRFGNDPLNLLAVDGPLNNQKGDGDAATWLPPNRAYRCEYVARQIAVKTSYGLWVTVAERAAMDKILATCPGQQLPLDATTPKDSSSKTGTAPEPTTKTNKKSSGTKDSSKKPASDVYYKNCDAARAAGADPVYRGDPGYGTHLDRNGDGVGCQ